MELRQGPLRASATSRASDRITRPLVRDARRRAAAEASWTEALAVAAAEGLRAARDDGGVGVLAGGRLTVEDAYAYAKFARRRAAAPTTSTSGPAPHSRRGAGTSSPRASPAPAPSAAGSPTPSSRRRPAVLLRRRWSRRRSRRSSSCGCARRRAAPAAGLRPRPVVTPAVLRTAARARLRAGRPAPALIARRRRAPGRRRSGATRRSPRAAARPGARRARRRAAAEVPGAAHRRRPTWPTRTGAARRPGCRGGPASAARVDAGALPHLLPGGRPVADAAARAERRAGLGRSTAGALPGRRPGRGHRPRSSPRPRTGELGGRCWSAASTRPTCPTRRPRRPALARVPASWSAWRCAPTAVTELADVVLPVAAGRGEVRHLPQLGGPAAAVRRRRCTSTGVLTDGRVLDTLGRRDGRRPAAPRRPAAAPASWRGLGAHAGRPAVGRRPTSPAGRRGRPRLRARPCSATWRQLLDGGSLLDGDEPALAGTARPAGGPARAGDGRSARASTDGDAGHGRADRRGSITLPVA